MEKQDYLKDELQPEHDLLAMRVRRVGANRKTFEDEDMRSECKINCIEAKPNRFADKRGQADEK